MREMILHIARRGAWEDAVRCGSYAPESLRVEGFIHCSTPAQVIDTANRFYRGQRDLIVLWIEESRVTAEVRYEGPAARPPGVGARNLTSNLVPSGKGNQKDDELFPHLYGALNVDAVVRVVELPCEDDGSFRLPREMMRGTLS
jgi:uncharacterized protein (DUF952 family)